VHAVPQPAFDRLEPVPELYATLPIDRAFNWDDCAEQGTRGEWYLVCFRSIRRPEADEALLQRLDDAAHEDAAASPGFVHYFKGATTSAGACLSFCLWQSRALARAAAGRPLHVEATTVTNEMYSSYRLEFYRVTKRPGSRHFEFAPYDGPSSVPTDARSGRSAA
jgi:hypothetical protein